MKNFLWMQGQEIRIGKVMVRLASLRRPFGKGGELYNTSMQPAQPPDKLTIQSHPGSSKRFRFFSSLAESRFKQLTIIIMSGKRSILAEREAYSLLGTQRFYMSAGCQK